MTAYNFETITAVQAAGIAATDSVTVTSVPAGFGISAAANADGTTTVTAGTVTQTFGPNLPTLSANDLFAFPATDTASGAVIFGTGATDTLTIAASNTSGLFDKTSLVFGFGGADAITVGGQGAHIVDAGAGDDTITIASRGAGTAAQGLSGNYFLAGGAGADTVNAATSTGNLHIYGGSRTDATINAADGADTIHAGTGSNYVNGNGGNDVIDVATGGTAGNRLNGGAGNDSITGGDGVDTINGNVGNDTIHGGLGNDSINGGQGNDVLFGDAGNDILSGDLGNDTLNGGAGIDVYTGGAGADRFVFDITGTASDAGVPVGGFVDSVTDFTRADGDKIDLKLVTFDPATTPSGTVANLIFVTDATFNTEAAAQNYANGQLATSPTATSTTVHDVVAIQVGADTFLFSHEVAATAGTAVDTVIKLANFTTNTLQSSDFV